MYTISDKVTNYKGYVIVKSSFSHCSFIHNKQKELIKHIAGDILSDGSNNAIEKAKKYIDTL